MNGTIQLFLRYPLESAATVLSLLWRVWWIFFRAPLEHHVVSDMSYYLMAARNLGSPDFSENPSLFTHPPGMPWLIALFGGGLGTGGTLKGLMAFMSVSTPLILTFTARKVFDARAARFCFWATTLYAPFWLYGSFLLAELPMIFMVSLSACLAALQFSTERARKNPVPLGLALGITTGLSLTLKITPLPGAVLLLLLLSAGAVHEWIPRGTFRKLLPTLAAFFVILAGLSIRGTLGTGKFNLGTNKFPGDFLIGNHGKVGLIEFQGGGGTWGSPTHAMRGWVDTYPVPYAIWDSQGLRDGLQWISENPFDAFAMNHLKVSAFLFDPPWPLSSIEAFWAQSYVSTLWMSVVGFFLALYGWVDAIRSRSGLRAICVPETYLLLPVFGLILSLLLTSAEARYRVPLDPLILLAAASGFSRLRSKNA